MGEVSDEDAATGVEIVFLSDDIRSIIAIHLLSAHGRSCDGRDHPGYA